MRLKNLLWITVLAAGTGCAGPAAVSSGMPYRRPVADLPSRPDAFRIMVFESSVRNDAERVTREIHLFQQAPVRLVYEEPYWRVLAGDFPRKLQALEALAGIAALGYAEARLIPLVRRDRIAVEEGEKADER